MSRIIDLTEQRFGRLTVVSRADNYKGGHARWNCVCSCGNTTTVIGSCLRNGSTKSCGCIRDEKTANLKKSHGKAKSRLYHIWKGIKCRVLNANTKDFKNYGGRDIGICKEWENDFSVFERWALSNGYSDVLTIDRIDNDKEYSPSNCRWTDIIVQSNNKRTNRRITYKGETKNLTEWARELNIDVRVLHGRIFRRNWSIDKAFTTPTK